MVEEEKIEESPAKAGEGRRDKEGKFLPGASGNPDGMKPGTISLTAMIKTALEKIVKSSTGEKKTRAQLMIDLIMDKAIDSKDIATIWNIINRIEGFPRQAVNLGSEEGITIIFKEVDKNGKGSPNDKRLPEEPPGIPPEKP